ncbi:unnamed protein product [Caenorhabditis auriculariae]|uniref:Uncharacterized protein n=1 Tax=Caenorhabditis auriculariae TaxID=2777116 RepID=A0A8S1H460_9PELO|nr:unnamed protein product [Caenorhabditis auriculariae]
MTAFQLLYTGYTLMCSIFSLFFCGIKIALTVLMFVKLDGMDENGVPLMKNLDVHGFYASLVLLETVGIVIAAVLIFLGVKQGLSLIADDPAKPIDYYLYCANGFTLTFIIYCMTFCILEMAHRSHLPEDARNTWLLCRSVNITALMQTSVSCMLQAVFLLLFRASCLSRFDKETLDANYEEIALQ